VSVDDLRGITIQVYRGAMSGTDAQKHAALEREMAVWKKLDVKGVMFHGFSNEMPAHVPYLLDAARAAGLRPSFSFGLDVSDEHGKAERIGPVAANPDVVATDLDEEGAADNNAQGFAKQFGIDLRAIAPAATFTTQPWPLPPYHPHFPYIEFAEFTDAVCPQFYIHAWMKQYGSRRYKVMWAKFEAAWQKLEQEVLAPKNLVRLRFPTVEGYRWDDIPYDCVDCFVKNERLIVWSEWKPTAVVLHAIEARQRIDRKVGLYVNGMWSGHDAVLRFQRAYNKKASTKLVEDGIYGPKTDRALFGGILVRMVRALGLAA
jgi:hypothetical protein